MKATAIRLPHRLNARTRPRSFVFAINVNWIRYYWTGQTDGATGLLERSAHRADAYKFNNSHAALLCAETHDELRDSSEWVLVPLMEAKRE